MAVMFENCVILKWTTAKWWCIKLCAIFSGPLCICKSWRFKL